MKQILTALTFSAILVYTPMGAPLFVHAETTQVEAATVTTSLPVAPEAALSLSDRKIKAVEDLTATLARLTSINQKIGITLERIEATSIQSPDARTAYAKAQSSILNAAKTLVALGDALVTGDVPKEGIDPKNILTEAMVKDRVLSIETDLITTRSALIETVTTLKASLTIAAQ